MRNILLAVLSAILLSISWPTYGFPFFIFIAFVPLLMLEKEISDAQMKRKGLKFFGLSFLTFIFWNIATTGWLYNAQNPDGSPALMAVIFPVVVNSLLMSTTFQFYYWFKKKKNLGLSLAFFIAVWMSFEKFHLEWEFSWPWLNLGNVFANYPEVIQWYDVVGATGGSFWILLINALVFYILKTGKTKQNYRNIVALSIIIVFPIVFSLVKYHSFDEKPIGKIKVMMLQPDLDPYTEKYQKDSTQIVDELLDLTKNYTQKLDYILAPETAFPGVGGISEKGFHNSDAIRKVKKVLEKSSSSVFVGGVSTFKVMNESKKTETAAYYPLYSIWLDSYNSAIQVVPNGSVDVYHKGKLVPGVEIFPYMTYLKPILGNVMLNFGGSVASLGVDKERKSFSNTYNKAKLAPVICYESIYGEYTTEYVNKGANFLAIMTNDSWWGVSQGHKQLLAYARLRAIETRREIARSANSGISAHINARGDIVSQTKYDTRDVLVSDVQLYEGETIYVKIGDIISKISLVFFGIMFIYRLFRGKKV